MELHSALLKGPTPLCYGPEGTATTKTTARIHGKTRKPASKANKKGGVTHKCPYKN